MYIEAPPASFEPPLLASDFVFHHVGMLLPPDVGYIKGLTFALATLVKNLWMHQSDGQQLLEVVYAHVQARAERYYHYSSVKVLDSVLREMMEPGLGEQTQDKYERS